MSGPFLMLSLLLKELSFIFYLLSLQLVLCHMAALKSDPVHRPKCSLYFTVGPFISAEIFRKIRKYYRFDPNILNSFSYLDPVKINVNV